MSEASNSNGYNLNNVLIPKEILLQIFRNLPVTDLNKCSAVCKSWQEIISDRYLWVKKFQEKFGHNPKKLDDFLIRLILNNCFGRDLLTLPIAYETTAEYADEEIYIYTTHRYLEIKKMPDLYKLIQKYRPTIQLVENIKISRATHHFPKYVLYIEMLSNNKVIDIVHKECLVEMQGVSVHYDLSEYPPNVDEIRFHHSMSFSRKNHNLIKISKQSGAVKIPLENVPVGSDSDSDDD